MIVWDVAQGSIAVEVLADHPLAEGAEFHRLFECVLDDPFAVLLDSAASASRYSRRSLIALEPEAVLVAQSSPLLAAGQAQIELQRWGERRDCAAVVQRYEAAPFAELERMLAERRLPSELRAQLPEGLVGGAIGFVGYDAGRFLERLPERAARDLELPELCLMFVDSLLVYEHEPRVLRWIASARGSDRDEAQRRCAARMAGLRARFGRVAADAELRTSISGEHGWARTSQHPELSDAAPRSAGVAAGRAEQASDEAPLAAPGVAASAGAPAGHAEQASDEAPFAGAGPGVAAGHVDQPSDEAPLVAPGVAASRAGQMRDAGATSHVGAVRAELDADAYAEMVRAAKAQITSGNVFEVCTSQRLEAPFPRDRRAIWSLYTALRAHSPAPFACCVLTPFACLLSSSPERFLQLSDTGWAESRPIKGTRPRGGSPEEDARLRHELAASEKDRAENVMIVDLVRNDLGRVCAIDSIHVPELMIVEEHPSLFQMVSTIRGRLEHGVSPVQLFTACFPPGSMTGAPKIEAMKVIDALEPVRRGIYAGAVGYFDIGGAFDFSVVIRSFVLSDGRCTLNVGGAVVADSDPAAEYRESMDKARALLAALDDQRGRVR